MVLKPEIILFLNSKRSSLTSAALSCNLQAKSPNDPSYYSYQGSKLCISQKGHSSVSYSSLLTQQEECCFQNFISLQHLKGSF